MAGMQTRLKYHVGEFEFARVSEKAVIGVHLFKNNRRTYFEEQRPEIDTINDVIRRERTEPLVTCGQARDRNGWNWLLIRDTNQFPDLKLNETPINELVAKASWSHAWPDHGAIAFVSRHYDAALLSEALKYYQIIPYKEGAVTREYPSQHYRNHTQVHVRPQELEQLERYFPREMRDEAKTSGMMSFGSMRRRLLKADWVLAEDDHFQGPDIRSDDIAAGVNKAVEALIFKAAGHPEPSADRPILHFNPYEINLICEAIPALQEHVKDAQDPPYRLLSTPAPVVKAAEDAELSEMRVTHQANGKQRTLFPD